MTEIDPNAAETPAPRRRRVKRRVTPRFHLSRKRQQIATAIVVAVVAGAAVAWLVEVNVGDDPPAAAQ